jgi:isopentenyl-diphosphate delta-isomerase
MLLQRRASGKYHCPGMWSNSCCGHPRPGHDIIAEAGMRLRVEIGVTAGISRIGTVSYRLPLDNDFTEWELDHVLVGHYSGPVTPNPAEVDDVQWVFSDDLKNALKDRSQSFTPWFSLILSKEIRWLTKTSQHSQSSNPVLQCLCRFQSSRRI